ncbi:MAG: hypothetical protein AB7Q00_01725 [Phycisphaerales bacterium]
MANVATGTITEMLEWLDNHQQLWNASAPELGISAPEALEMKNLYIAAQGAYDAASAARQASKNATSLLRSTLGAARSKGSALSRDIVSFIEQSGNEDLWALAGLTPPAAPGEAPPPNAPTELFATLDSIGNVIVSWRATQPAGTSGTIYQVRRALDNETGFTLLDVVGEKTFTDETVPLGTTTVQYVVYARRSGVLSEPSPVLALRFGRVGVGSGMSIVGQTLQSAPISAKAA